MSLFRLLVSDLRKMVKDAQHIQDHFFTVDGNGIRLCCVDFAPSPLLFSSIRYMFRPKNNNVDYEGFYCFLKDTAALIRFLPEQMLKTKGRYIYNCEEGRLAASVEFGFFSVYSAEYNETYIWICQDKHLIDVFISHPFRMEFSWWAQRKGYTFLHSAAIGTKGKGVLISGAGGSGKSTLSMSALLTGMDFLSDDYLLVKRGARPVAVRLYSTGYLKEDILARLPEFKKEVFWSSKTRDKGLLALDAFGGRVTDRLLLHAIITPHVAHASEPAIKRIPDVRTLIPLLASTSYQNRELKNKSVFFAMMSLLRNLPAFDFILTDDLKHNARFLKQWMENL